MSAIHYIARPWQCHAATSVGYEIDGHFYQVAECSGFGRSAEEAEQTAAQIVAALNGANGVRVGAFRIYDEDGGKVWIRREGGEGGLFTPASSRLLFKRSTRSTFDMSAKDDADLDAGTAGGGAGGRAGGDAGQQEREMSDLHTAIMNLPLPANLAMDSAPVLLSVYKLGHRDARHAAAELAQEYAASHQRLKEALELIHNTDPVDAALDPRRAIRIAREALKDAP